MRPTVLPFALPELGEAELTEIKEVLESGWISTGPKVHRFEQEFAAHLGAKFAVAVNSCTAAMHLALDAVGVQAGDYVVTTPYTFAATADPAGAWLCGGGAGAGVICRTTAVP